MLVLLLAAPLVGGCTVRVSRSRSTDRQAVDDLIHQLTPAEKTSLLSTTAPAIDRLKIPVMNGWNQSLHGIVWSAADDDVSGTDQHGGDMGPVIGSRCGRGDCRRGQSRLQLLA